MLTPNMALRENRINGGMLCRDAYHKKFKKIVNALDILGTIV